MKHNIPLPEIKRIPAMTRDVDQKLSPTNNDAKEKSPQVIKPRSTEDEAQKRRTTPSTPLASETEQQKTSEFKPMVDEVEHIKK